MGETLRIEAMTGEALREHLCDLARLRIEVFREYPYLYEGDLDYERRYLQKYVVAPGAVIVLVLDGERVVGASTALPLLHADAEFQRPFQEHGYALDEVFYLGESVLLPAYRGRGLGGRFFEAREAQARRLGGLRWTAFCAVERPADHPRRPRDYRPHDAFWSKRGYRRHPELVTRYHWRDVGEARETDKSMIFWLKPLVQEGA